MKVRALPAALTLVLAALTVVSTGLAHENGHEHAGKLNDEGAIAFASAAVSQLIQQKQLIEGAVLDGAWATIPAADRKVSKKDRGYYIVSFTNAAAGKSLYVLLSDTGVFYDLNYTGAFPALKE